MLKARHALLLLLLVAVILCASAMSAPAYVSQHFEVYDSVGAGSEYAAAVAGALEEAYAAYAGNGAALAPPCSGERYTVNIVAVGGEAGYVRWQYSYDANGNILKTCIVEVDISKGLAGGQLRKVAYHELGHVAQAAYFKHVSVVQAYPWYVEASAEGLAGGLSGVCGWEPYYFSYGLYGRNPYSYSDGATECYAYSAFYYWVLRSGYASLPQALLGTLSGSSAVSSWANEAYTRFLLSLARGVTLCGSTYSPSFADVRVSGGSASISVSLSGLSAAYYRVLLPAPGTVQISAPSGLASNILLGKPFRTGNTTLLLALVNPSLSTAGGVVTVTYVSALEAAVAGGVFDPSTGTLSVTLSLKYLGEPVTGTVYVNGSAVQASSGSASVQLNGLSWGTYTLRVEYSNESASVSVRVAEPTASLETAMPLYLARSGYGDLVVAVSNNGDVAVRLSVGVSAPPFLGFEGATALEAPPGRTTLSLKFRVTGEVEPAVGAVTLYAGAYSVNLSFAVQPSSVRVVEASYDSEKNTTTATVAADPPGLQQTTSFRGLSGTAWLRISTYFVGGVEVSVPEPRVEPRAEPLLVAPSWVLAELRASVAVAGSCPGYPVRYTVAVRVNGSRVGVASFECGETASLSASLNLTYGPAGRLVLVLEPGRPVELQVPRPEVSVEAVKWLLVDEGSLVEAELGVRGSCKYLFLGSVVANSTVKVEKKLRAGERQFVLDTGFVALNFTMPPVRLELRAPRAVLAPQNLRLLVVLETPASVNASFVVSLNGVAVGRVRLVKAGGGEASAPLELGGLKPGVYDVRVESWFASTSAQVAYVELRGLRVEAPSFVLVNRSAEVRVIAYAEPPVELPVNITLAGCSPASLQASANSTLTLVQANPCTAVITASLYNFSATAAVRWDKLVVTPERVLAVRAGGFVVPSGPVAFAARFSNGSRAPAAVTVEGLTPSLGLHRVSVKAEYMGQVNSTVIAVYVAPEDLYLRASSALSALGEAPHLSAALEEALESGDWGSIAEFVSAYEAAESRARLYLPLSLLSEYLVEQWARSGGGALQLASALLTAEPLLYATAAAVALWARRRARRVHARSRS